MELESFISLLSVFSISWPEAHISAAFLYLCANSDEFQNFMSSSPTEFRDFMSGNADCNRIFGFPTRSPTEFEFRKVLAQVEQEKYPEFWNVLEIAPNQKVCKDGFRNRGWRRSGKRGACDAHRNRKSAAFSKCVFETSNEKKTTRTGLVC